MTFPDPAPAERGFGRRLWGQGGGQEEEEEVCGGLGKAERAGED